MQTFSIPDGWQINPNGRSVRLIAPSEIEAQFFVKGAKNNLLQMSRRLGFPVLVLANGEPIAQFGNQYSEESDMANTRSPVWIANCGILSRELLELAIDMQDHPRKEGVIRLSDELQILISDGSASMNVGHEPVTWTTWTREMFWHPEDLETIRRRSRQESSFEMTYRSFDPVRGLADENWLEYTNRYRLLESAGESFHIWSNLDMQEIGSVVVVL